MHHVVVERWSRRSSPLHSRDSRAKLAVLLVFLAAVATTPLGAWIAIAAYLALLAVAAVASRLPLRSLLARALLILPFSATFALITWWSGDPQRAASLASKAFLSGLASLLLIATTPMTELAAALDALHVPRTLVLVIQFLYRYLFVIAEQAQHMRLAARSRLGQAKPSVLGILFVRSWERADGIYRSMLARGFRGRMPLLNTPHFHRADFVFLGLGCLASAAIRLAL